MLSHVSDLENPQFYTITRQQVYTVDYLFLLHYSEDFLNSQLKSVALRVILWEAKNNKHSSFVGEVRI